MKKIKIFLDMIKFEHTVFALPFAYLGAFLAAGGLPEVSDIFWITAAMIGARTAAMSLNRIIDRKYDGHNPRTSERALPQGKLSVKEVWLYVLASFILLYVSASMLDPLCVKLMPIAVFILIFYHYTKRWSWLCHLVLGAADGLAPLGGWIAITGSVDLPGILLGLAVAMWVAGFDLIYSCQDADFDRFYGLHSIPAKFGIKASFNISLILHALALGFLIYTGVFLDMGFLYWTGIFLASVILYCEHRLVTPHDFSRLGFAFLNMNGYLSIIVFLFTLLELII